MASKNKLFSEFPPVSTSKWEEEIQKDLKGADYNKKLVWNTPEGLKVKPYYRNENLEDKKYLDILPGEFPYVRGNKPNENEWEIRQDIKLDNIKFANQKSIFILDRGINSLGFLAHREKGKIVVKSQADFAALLNGIYIDCISLNFICGNNGPEMLEFINNEVKSRNLDANKIFGSIDFDPLGNLTFTGNFAENEQQDLNRLENILKYASSNLPNYRVIGVNAYMLNNAGATIIQELGYGLAMAADYMSILTNKGYSPDVISKHMQFNFGVGSNYFMEIAKIRAARVLWSKIVEAFKPNSTDACKAFIHSVTSEWNQTIYDPYVNVLRGTTEAMSAVIGGTDSLAVRPFDFSYKTISKFSGRLARNIQIILKEESYMNKIVDPGAGSYYIENLTDSIIDEAWKIFLKVEEAGGYLEAIKKGVIQADIEATINTRNNSISTRREILLGTNQYPNLTETANENIMDEIAFPKVDTAKTFVKPILKYRGSMDFEKLRLAVEKHPEGRPNVFLLAYGNMAMRKARAAFSLNFFACAGYNIIDNNGFENAEEGVKAALAAKANIVVVCSSDEEYAEFVPEVYKHLNGKAILVVAGNPECTDELKSKGIENFISVKSNILETLKEYHKKLGIL